MADVSLMKKDVKLSSVSRAAEQQQLDLGGIRIGKQRLVAKKKRQSALKKLILEEREDKQIEREGGGAASTLRSGKQTEATSGALSDDVEEFVPAFLKPSAQETVAEAASSQPAESSTAPSTEVGGKRQGSSKGPRKSQAAALSTAAPEFVPSWCRPTPGEDADGAAAAAAEGDVDDIDLPVGEAMDRLRAMKEEQKAPKEKKQAAGADNIEVRHYVHQVLSNELDEKVKAMLQQLSQYQERAKEKDPLKYQKLKRLCFGMREAQRAIGRGKAKCLILAPNLEECPLEGGLDDTVELLIEECRDKEVPVVFALSRNRIGKALGKSIRLSIVCVLSAEGAHQLLKETIKLTEELRKQWVLRQMMHRAQVTEEEAAEEARLVEERNAARAARRAERQRLEQEQKEEEERQRAEAKAAKEAAKAERIAARERAAEEKRQRKKAEQAAREAREKLSPEAEKAAEEEKAAALRAAEKQREEARREAERKAEEERRKLQELIKKRAEEAKAQAEEEGDESSDEDLPL
eukprot:CAMPEP_0178381052 /NCGR_PEP_ID=MMETSP0689_2-20121128/5783_1 /TAXON_ID=160604 /ORGANISM="Amphidinium massartii, Strain CS-259" /LENGTH=520 /DNA_ID=CAMNT_0020001221 /DNA_START=19 /DNA_END=1577 /DNA_ORIENTATION=+